MRGGDAKRLPFIALLGRDWLSSIEIGEVDRVVEPGLFLVVLLHCLILVVLLSPDRLGSYRAFVSAGSRDNRACGVGGGGRLRLRRENVRSITCRS